MLIYLDQNKWIALARMVYGKDKSQLSKTIVENTLKAVEDGRIIIVLSAIHYMETARISNFNRRKRLGKVMWKYSKGRTLASYRRIVIHELETALSEFFRIKNKTPFQLVGYGVSHAFGEPLNTTFPKFIEETVEESMLTGEGPNGEVMPGFHQTKYRENFMNHLEKLPSVREEVPRNKWDDCLYAICTMDIREPLKGVMLSESISPERFGALGPENLRKMVDLMPTRQMDFFLHRQVLQNPSLKPKITDLEDWAGLGVATQYCELVICEKHFQAMTSRKGYKGKARVTKNLEVLTEI